MAALLNRIAAHAPVRAAGVAPVARSRARRSVVAFVEDPKFTLETSKAGAEGFIEKDTAGQSNMYPTITKAYEAGSTSDTVQQDSFNNGLAVAASVVALGAIALGLTALIGSAPAPEEDFSQYASLSSYSAKFASEFAPPPPPPPPAPVAVAEPAPEVLAVVAVEEEAPAPAPATAEEEAPVAEAAAVAVAVSAE